MSAMKDLSAAGRLFGKLLFGDGEGALEVLTEDEPPQTSRETHEGDPPCGRVDAAGLHGPALQCQGHGEGGTCIMGAKT